MLDDWKVGRRCSPDLRIRAVGRECEWLNEIRICSRCVSNQGIPAWKVTNKIEKTEEIVALMEKRNE